MISSKFGRAVDPSLGRLSGCPKQIGFSGRIYGHSDKTPTAILIAMGLAAYRAPHPTKVGLDPTPSCSVRDPCSNLLTPRAGHHTVERVANCQFAPL